MAILEVIRQSPPEYGYCRSPQCERPIEWVTTIKGRRMPVDHPLIVERQYVRLDNTIVIVIDSSHSHFATCREADRFRRDRKAAR